MSSKRRFGLRANLWAVFIDIDHGIALVLDESVIDTTV